MASNVNTPYGLVPVQRLDGAEWVNSLRVYFVPAANTHALYVGDPVIKVTGSADTNGVNGVDLASAGSSNKITGVVCGFVGSCTAGTANPSLFGSSGTPGALFRPASTGLDYYVLVNDDPEAQFYIQENDNSGGVAGTPLPVTAVGKNANLVSGSGSAFTGWSGWMLDANAVATSATNQLRIIGFAPPPNVAASAFSKVIVQINLHTELPNSAGI